MSEVFTLIVATFSYDGMITEIISGVLKQDEKTSISTLVLLKVRSRVLPKDVLHTIAKHLWSMRKPPTVEIVLRTYDCENTFEQVVISHFHRLLEITEPTCQHIFFDNGMLDFIRHTKSMSDVKLVWNPIQLYNPHDGLHTRLVDTVKRYKSKHK